MQSPINLATSLDPGADCVNQPEVGRARRRTYYGNSSLRRWARVRPRGACGRAQSQGRCRSRGRRQRGRGSRDLPSRSAAGFGQRDKYWSARGYPRRRGLDAPTIEIHGCRSFDGCPLLVWWVVPAHLVIGSLGREAASTARVPSARRLLRPAPRYQAAVVPALRGILASSLSDPLLRSGTTSRRHHRSPVAWAAATLAWGGNEGEQAPTPEEAAARGPGPSTPGGGPCGWART
jgi:hypothetical protein